MRGFQVVLLLLLVLSCSMELPAQDRSIEKRAYEDTRKIVVMKGDKEAEEATKNLEVRQAFEYEDRTVLLVDDRAVRALSRTAMGKVCFQDDMNRIFLRGQFIDTTRPAMAVPRALSFSLTDEDRLYLVQFAGPIKEAWLQELQAAGRMKVVTYLRSNGYLIWAPGATIDKLQQSMKEMPYLQWIGPYHPAYALAPSLQATTHDPTQTDPVQVTVQLVDFEGVESFVGLVKENAKTILRDVWTVGPYKNLRIEVDPAMLESIATVPGVVNVEPFIEPSTNGERQGQIVAGQLNAAGSQPTGPGYLAWLNSVGLGTPAGPMFADITVNTNSNGHQLRPAIAVDSGGGFVVVWDDDNDKNGKYQIYARGFHANGTQRFADMTVNSVSSGQQFNSAIAMAPDGRFVVVWEDDNDENGWYQIYARGFNADGTQRFADVTVNSVSSGQQFDPAIAMASDGTFVVAWEDDKDENGWYQILARGFNANGTQRFSDITVNTVSSGQQLDPAIAMDSQGRFVVAWADDKDKNGKYQILARGFHASGSQRIPDFTVNSVSSGQQLEPDISMKGDGRFVVVWTDDKDENNTYQILARGFHGGGQPRIADFTVNSVSKGQQHLPSVAVDRQTGDFVVVWEDDSNDNGIYEILARGFDFDGSESFSDLTVNSVSKGHQLCPVVGAADSGGFAVAWQDDSNDNKVYEIMARGLFSRFQFVVDVTDDGFDRGRTDTANVHPDFARPGGISRMAYVQNVAGTTITTNAANCDNIGGHGTINAGIVGGFNNRVDLPWAGTDFEDAAGYQYGLGIAPFVRLGSSRIFPWNTWNSPDFTELTNAAYRKGARISNNSWGSSCGGGCCPAGTLADYTATSQEFDGLVRDARPSGASDGGKSGNQEMVILFSAGNLDSCATGESLGNNGSTAKNTIVVGATENWNQAGTDGGGWTNADADDPREIATFSSRGPCQDGRIKPDIVAPGTHIYGPASQHANFDGSSVSGLPGVGNPHAPAGQTLYTWSTGTSHSTPAVTGAAALLREWYQDAYGKVPSPAMTKAFLLNSTNWITGAGANDDLPSNAQGMGQINLDRAFDGTSRIVVDQSRTLDQSGDVYSIRGNIVDTGLPFRVTLAWTDAPGPTVGDALVNDLDLTVTVTSGGATTTYLGNHFNNNVSQPQPGGAVDQLNNVESVWLPAGTTGRIRVTVNGSIIAGDGIPQVGDGFDQDFALVVYNANKSRIEFELEEWCPRYPRLCEELIPVDICRRIPELCEPLVPEFWRDWMKFEFRHPLDKVIIPVPGICQYVIDCPGCDQVGLCDYYSFVLDGIREPLLFEVLNSRAETVTSAVSRRGRAALQFRSSRGEFYFLVIKPGENSKLDAVEKVRIRFVENPR